MGINKILVGVDFSDEANMAVKEALNVARRCDAEVVLVHVGAIPDEPTGLPKSMEATANEYRKVLEDHLAGDRKRLEALRERVDGQGARVSHMVIDGFPDKGVCQAADELDVDLVCVGTHGLTGVKRFLLGSVAERVVRLCERNVLVARHAATDGYGGYKRVLVPTDFTDGAARALDLALEVAAPDAQIDVLHCWQLAPLSFDVFAPTKSAAESVRPMREAIKASVDANGERLLEKLDTRQQRVTFDSVEAPAPRGIHDRLDASEYDLVVMGSHGRRGLRRFLLGSVAEVTVRHAPCSVLVVHVGTV